MKNKQRVEYPIGHPGTGCYTMPSDGGKGHYKALSYYVKGKKKPRILVTVIHGRNSYLPGTAVVDVPFEDLVPCGCGKFKWWKP